MSHIHISQKKKLKIYFTAILETLTSLLDAFYASMHSTGFVLYLVTNNNTDYNFLVYVCNTRHRASTANSVNSVLFS